MPGRRRRAEPASRRHKVRRRRARRIGSPRPRPARAARRAAGTVVARLLDVGRQPLVEEVAKRLEPAGRDASVLRPWRGRRRRCSRPLSLAASTAAPRSTPEIDRPDPLPVPSSISAMTIAGRPKRSLIRPATMPITPGCQPLAMTMMHGRAVALRGLFLRLLAYQHLDRAALLVEPVELGGNASRASSGSVRGQQPHAEVRLADPAAGVDPWPEREAEIAARSAPSPVARPPRAPQARCSAARAITFRPCVTKARLSDFSRATSATVPSATRSSRSMILGSASAAKKPRLAAAHAATRRQAGTPSRPRRGDRAPPHPRFRRAGWD